MKNLVGRYVSCAGLGALVFFLGVAPAAAGSDVCKATARLALNACRLGAGDDYAIAQGKCLNVADAGARSACNDAAAEERSSALDDCKDQLGARLDTCEDLGGGLFDPVIDPNDFTTVIDNPLYPLVPGTTYVYESRTASGLERDVMEVTHATRVIMGVPCVEVHDALSLNGELVEDTLDWYAQDGAGNVWYFGENSRELEDGLAVSLEGSWVAGVDGAKPGIIMEASPRVGDVYRQEFDLGNAEDMGAVLSLDATATVPYGSFTRLLETRDYTALEPDVTEHKFYAAGIGNVLETDPVTGERTELVSVTP